MLAYLERCGKQFDIMVNVLTGGIGGQTISFRAALAAANGGTAGCAVCWVLNYIIERDHCAKTLSGETSTTKAVIRSAIAFTVGIISVIALLRLAYEVL